MTAHIARAANYILGAYEQVAELVTIATAAGTDTTDLGEAASRLRAAYIALTHDAGRITEIAVAVVDKHTTGTAAYHARIQALRTERAALEAREADSEARFDR